MPRGATEPGQRLGRKHPRAVEAFRLLAIGVRHPDGAPTAAARAGPGAPDAVHEFELSSYPPMERDTFGCSPLREETLPGCGYGRVTGHESTRTTQLYNRLPEEISLDKIERIHI